MAFIYPYGSVGESKNGGQICGRIAKSGRPIDHPCYEFPFVEIEHPYQNLQWTSEWWMRNSTKLTWWVIRMIIRSRGNLLEWICLIASPHFLSALGTTTNSTAPSWKNRFSSVFHWLHRFVGTMIRWGHEGRPSARPAKKFAKEIYQLIN